jgi:hypothetical protein
MNLNWTEEGAVTLVENDNVQWYQVGAIYHGDEVPSVTLPTVVTHAFTNIEPMP